jgi:hypothetical protein
MKKRLTIVFGLIFFIFPFLRGGYKVVKVDFPAFGNLAVNAAGPLLIESDPVQNRIVLANTFTSSVSLISGLDHSVTNIPIAGRIPQYLKDEALRIDRISGQVYLVGNLCLHIINPQERRSVSVKTPDQFDMVAINEKNSDAYLVGRSSYFLGIFSKKTGKFRTVRWVEKRETMTNLNQTPPPPIRKVVFDPGLNRVAALDGYTSTLYIFSPSGKILKKRKLAVRDGLRWHFAGYQEKEHKLYVVIETGKREVIQAAKIDIAGREDCVVDLPGFTEAVGVIKNPVKDEVYIPYDNHPSIHAVSFGNGGHVREIKIPTYGNDASAIDPERQLLFVSSWAYGEINVVDLVKNVLKKRICNLGIIPHMFSMCFHPNNGRLYIPVGATAVNGSFGAAVTSLDITGYRTEKVILGWSPVDLLPLKGRDRFLVFNSEGAMAEVSPEGTFEVHQLPIDYPCRAISLPDGYIYLAYGPHQSYWPVVYIWGAKNGILGIDPGSLETNDRRIPRLAQQMAVDKSGVLYALQNNWGLENQFLAVLPDPVRSPNQGDMRWEVNHPVVRETTQRILKYDPDRNWLYLVSVGEQDNESGLLQILDINSRKVLLSYPVGLTPVDLVFDEAEIYVSCFDSNTIAVINKSDFSVRKIKTGEKPFQLVLKGHDLYCINHNGRSLQVSGDRNKTYPIPFPGRPDALSEFGEGLVLTVHDCNRLNVVLFNPADETFTRIHEEPYPYGETTVDTGNSAFFVRGQFGDAIFQINQIKQDENGRLWITDFLSGRLFIISKN